MAYLIQAIIGNGAMLQAHCPPLATVVVMPQGKAMIPLTDKLREHYEIPFAPLTDSAPLPDSVTEFVLPLVGHGKFVYIEAEFFGGDGTQACVTWDDAGISSIPLVDTHAINTSLKFLGVQVGNNFDEFEALGLQRHRHTDQWEAESNATKT